MAPNLDCSSHLSVLSKWQFKGLPGSRTIFTGPPGQFQWVRGSLRGENYRKSQAMGAAILSWPSRRPIWQTEAFEEAAFAPNVFTDS